VVKKLLPSLAHPASIALARTSAIGEARRLNDMDQHPRKSVSVVACNALRLHSYFAGFIPDS
jgi:hypothetical protein